MQAYLFLVINICQSVGYDFYFISPVFRTFFATPANYLIIKYNILFLGVAKKIICILENL